MAGDLTQPRMHGAWQRDLGLLICPACRVPLEIRSDDGANGVLAHGEGPCNQAFPVIGGIPRLLIGGARLELTAAYPAWFRGHPELHAWSSEQVGGADLRIVRRFDEEWREFARMGVDERGAVFARYLDLIPETMLGPGRMVLDAGCGGGRWAAEVAQRGARVIALDLGRSVEVAARHAGLSNVYVQADVRNVPVAPGSVDFAYSLGVLHHINEPDVAVRRIVDSLRPGGSFLIYLYYALDDRGRMFRAAFGAVDLLRRLISRLPQPLVRAITSLIAALVYFPLARGASALDAVGLGRVADRIPLRFYSRLSFRTMRNDSLDRFGTALERRYRRDEVVSLLERAGLTDVRVSDAAPYWHAVGRRPD